ncbi:hypothetical protein ACQKOF_04195 [Lysinibacillus sp. NPDC093190]|uniref:hypothetical protein n=1 Tax=Lysinibacillus sp. NPDC093190 TaxID=3390575 RepID=UPI003D048344
MNFLGKKTLLTGASIALLGTTFALSPVSISKTESGVKLSAPVAEAAASDWVYVETKKKDTGAQNAMTVATASALGALLGIAAPYTSPLSAFGVVILDKSLKTAYFTDKIWMRMAGSTFQNKHEITMYSDSSYKKKLKTVTLVENISAGPKSIK